MQNLKNILIGFLISFIGSIPLGYLNVIGFEIYSNNGLNQTNFYLLGVITIEFLVIFSTLLFANKLNSNKKYLKYIDVFSIVFMFVLAYVFYTNGNSEQINRTVFSNISNNFYFAGILYSSLNFIQIPFWLSWNLYLINGEYIEVTNSKKYFYLFGTVTGTFCGMMALILSLNYLTTSFEFIKFFLFKFIIPLVFVFLGIIQIIKFYGIHKKHE